ncbi:MAG: nitronate monooxygenase, partial [Microthrixaceae bacterium]|nr:nitronate monooxygenase [Microthrixaceae bacterium]
MQTRLTEMLQIEHPVMLAGMGGVSYHEVVAAVSDAGGFGCLGASAMSNDRLVAEMTGVRERTDRGFGVDLLTAMPGDMAIQVRLLIEGGATLFVAGLGIPRDVIDLCHDNNVLVGS